MNCNFKSMAVQGLMAVSLLGVAACHSGWEQDPFKDSPQNIKKAVPQGTQKANIPPVRDVIFIDSDPMYTEAEGQTLFIKFGHRITHKEFEFKRMEVENLEDVLPGAVFDPSTFELQYEVPMGYLSPGVMIESHNLTVSAYAEYLGVEHKASQNITVNIVKGTGLPPVIEEVDGLPVTLQEDSSNYEFMVKVRDPVSRFGPRLTTATMSPYVKNGSAFVSFRDPVQDVNDPEVWNIIGVVRLMFQQDLTDDKDTFKLKFVAYSAYGLPSDVNSQEIHVETLPEEPVFSLSDDVHFKVDQNNRFSFDVVDPKDEGVVSAKFVDRTCYENLQVDYKCECRTVLSKRHISRCTVSWKPRKTGDYYVDLEAVNSVEITYSKHYEEKSSDKLKIRVTN